MILVSQSPPPDPSRLPSPSAPATLSPPPLGHVAPTASAASAGPLPASERQLAPDLARGLMLLLIAVANVWTYLYGRGTGYGSRPEVASGIDHAADALVAFVADDRSRPLFAILYGFGIAMMVHRMAMRGVPKAQANRVLLRRSLGLVVLGLLHAALLFLGDILASYGLTGLLAIVLVHASTRALWHWLGWTFGLYALIGVGMGALEVFVPDASGMLELSASYPVSMLERAALGLGNSVIAGVTLLFISQVAVGILVFRAGWLADPVRHRVTLRRVAVAGLVINVVFNTPHALAVGQVWQPEGGVALLASAAHWISGVPVALGYLAAFALLAARLTGAGRPASVAGAGPATRAVAATGARSLTAYLGQSIVLAPLFSAWGLAWGATWGTAAATAVAIGVWALTVVVCALLDRAGRRGPFEVALRRFSYGRRPRG